MTRLETSPVAREIAWSLAGLAATLIVVRGAAWSYPQGAGTIWAVGAATLAAVALLGVRDVRRVARTRSFLSSPSDKAHHG